MTSRALAVFDLDGTLADVRHRLPFLQRRPKDWDAFFRAAVDDPPLEQGIELAKRAAGRCEVVYVTGRPEGCRRETLEWLARYGLPGGDLRMRGAGDRRPARVTKPELLHRLAADRVVEMVVDDDEQVCEAYERAGFPVVRAGWMVQPTVLEQAQESEGRT